MIKTNLVNVKNLIAAFEQKYGRAPSAVQLLAVTKGRSIEEIEQALLAGQTRFGESYLQEATAKITALTNYPIEWHFIGPIQSNKTRKIAGLFSWVHSVSSQKIAQRLSDQRPLHLPPLNICLEINISNEDSKSGVKVTEAWELANFCKHLPNLHVRGLMAVPALESNFLKQRAIFHELYELQQTLNAQGLQLDTLSMGMSADFEAAIAEGATIVRIGTAIFASE